MLTLRILLTFALTCIENTGIPGFLWTEVIGLTLTQ
jgi:hypothetical protein